MYQFEFEINELPKTINEIGRKHRWVKSRHRDEWKSMVWAATAGHLPPQPLLKARITFTRCSWRQPDYDNMVSAFKDVLDALKKRIIIDDNNKVIPDHPTYKWEKAKRGEGKIKVQIEEIE